MPIGAGSVTPVHVLNKILTPAHALKAADRAQSLGEVQLAPKSRCIFITIRDGDGATIASASGQGLESLIILSATVPCGRTLAPVLMCRDL